MQKRTVIRTILDIFLDNAFVKTAAYIVNFCNEQRYYHKHELKFLRNVPINKIETSTVENNFLFKVNR